MRVNNNHYYFPLQVMLQNFRQTVLILSTVVRLFGVRGHPQYLSYPHHHPLQPREIMNLKHGNHLLDFLLFGSSV